MGTGCTSTYHSMLHSMGSEKSFYTFQQSFSSGPSSSRQTLLVDLTGPENASFLVEVTILWNMSVRKKYSHVKIWIKE